MIHTVVSPIKRNNKHHCLDMAGTLIYISAIIMSAILCLYSTPIKIERPFILLVAAIFTIFSFKRGHNLLLLQKIILLYLVEILFNQLSRQFIQIPFGRESITIQVSFITLLLLATGFILKKAGVGTTCNIVSGDIMLSWAAVFAAIIIHMSVLLLLLKRFYGYGSEHDGGVLAGLCLYFLVFLFSWSQFDHKHLRQITAMVLSILFLLMFIAKR